MSVAKDQQERQARRKEKDGMGIGSLFSVHDTMEKSQQYLCLSSASTVFPGKVQRDSCHWESIKPFATTTALFWSIIYVAEKQTLAKGEGKS